MSFLINSPEAGRGVRTKDKTMSKIECNNNKIPLECRDLAYETDGLAVCDCFASKEM
jgi:hypothetical protein